MSRTMQRLALFSLLMLAAFGLYTLRSVWQETESARQRLLLLEGQRERQREINSLLERQLSQQGSQEELERIGREQLFLVYPDEKIFIDSGN